MPDVNWSDEATRVAARLARAAGRPARGVLTRAEDTGVYAVFAPPGELPAVADRLAAAGVELLGPPAAADGPAAVAAMFVRGGCGVDWARLWAIVSGADPTPAAGCKL